MDIYAKELRSNAKKQKKRAMPAALEGVASK